MSRNIYQAAYDCLACRDLEQKLRLATALYDDWKAGDLAVAPANDTALVEQAGHPDRPELVPPSEVPRRRIGSPEGHAALIHAVAHIEFNAINLACDAVYRFRDMPAEYYADWLKVAAEESCHFSLLQGRLIELGFSYGDFAAHNGLWELALKTRDDLLVRMALVPRLMEARGLDVTPGMMQKFEKIGDQATADILKIILRDEIGHVEAGSRWFHYLCDQRGLEAESTYFSLIEEYFSGGIQCPLHKEARLDAGFSQSELTRLEALCKRS